MPSSPDAFVPADLPDLSGHPLLTSTGEAPQFVAAPADGTPATAPLFEVSRTSGVPEELLAPARAAAQAAGYAAGWAQGVRAARLVSDAEAQAARSARERAEADRAADVARALAALDAAATTLERHAVPGAREVEGLIVAAALDIAEALVGCALRDDAVRGQAALTRALSLTPADEAVTVALSPADYAAVEADVVNGASAGSFGRSITLVTDPALAPGDATATCGATTVDARISTGLARVRELLAASGTPAPATPAASDVLVHA